MKILYILLLIIGPVIGFAQPSFQYNVVLEPITVSGFPGIHSYAFAQHDGKWLIIGGRLDGLHPRQPFAAFPENQNNTNLYVLDIKNKNYWFASVNTLSTNIKEQLQSTNMNFFQDGDLLVIAGGYAYSATAADHITFPNLCVINVPAIMDAIIQSNSISGHIKQINDSRFAVTGGQLGKIGSDYYLIGGHRFDGRYNPMGHNTYVQTYTNQIRKFTLDNSGALPVVNTYSTINDAVHLHRRDYSLVPQIFPDGSEGYTMASGVFRVDADLPYLYPVDVKNNGIVPQTGFNQYLSNYHCASAALYDSVSNSMHSLFFGGMSQYYYENGNLIQDNSVPFVKTISRVSRAADGSLFEYKLSTEMPGLRGASSEFILNEELKHYSNEVIKISEFKSDTAVIGHVLGGISSPMLNPFASNQTSLTSADPTIYEVKLIKSEYASITDINGANPYSIEVFPNPAKNRLTINFDLTRPTEVEYYLTDSNGKIVLSNNAGILKNGNNKIEIEFQDKEANHVLFLNVIFEKRYFVTRKIVVE